MHVPSRQEQDARLDQIAEQQVASPIPLLFHLVLIGAFAYIGFHALQDERWVILSVSLAVIAIAVNNIVWPRRRVRRARADELRGLP